MLNSHFLGALLLSTIFVGGLAAEVPAHTKSSSRIALKVSKVFIGDGSFVDGSVIVLMDDNRITSISKFIPEEVLKNYELVEIGAGSITPGLIDANARIESLDVVSKNKRTAREVMMDLFGTARPEQSLEGRIAQGTVSSEELDAILHGSTIDQLGCTDHVHEMECLDSTCEEHAVLDPLEEAQSCCGICGGNLSSPADMIAASGLAMRSPSGEQSSEVVPQTRIIDGLDLSSPDFQRLLRGGVTTVYCSPDSSAVIGAKGAVVRTAGEQRILLEAAAVKASMGLDPAWVGSSNRPGFRRFIRETTRRPTTRMGVTWVFRKAMYDTLLRRDGRPPSGGADTPTVEASRALMDVLDGSTPLRIQARAHHDIATAIRLSREFGLRFVLEEATEAYKCMDLLKRGRVPVIFGPIYDIPTTNTLRAFSGDTQGSKLNTFTHLLNSGLPVALSAQDLREEDGLARQAMYALRYGASLAQVLPSVTSVPARMIGVAEHVGTLEVGKRADLVLWSGMPFAATSRPLIVVIDGKIVLDHRG